MITARELVPALGLPTWEAERILMSLDDRVATRADLYLSERPLGEATLNRARVFASKRAAGVPLQYLLGEQQFFGNTYQVGPGVLVPRPETEALVEVTSAFVDSLASPSVGFEIGVGSGNISIELLSRHPELSMVASEWSPVATDFAYLNARHILGGSCSRLEIIQALERSQVMEPFAGRPRADFVVSNPPYLSPLDDIALDVRTHEPSEALYPAELDPSFFYRQFAKRADSLLSPWGKLFAEIPHERADEIAEIFYEHGWLTSTTADLTGRARVLGAWRG